MEINHNKVRNESRNLQHQNTFTLGFNSSKRPPLAFICPNLQLSIKLLTEKRIEFQDSENILMHPSLCGLCLLNHRSPFSNG